MNYYECDFEFNKATGNLIKVLQTPYETKKIYYNTSNLYKIENGKADIIKIDSVKVQKNRTIITSFKNEEDYYNNLPYEVLNKTANYSLHLSNLNSKFGTPKAVEHKQVVEYNDDIETINDILLTYHYTEGAKISSNNLSKNAECIINKTATIQTKPHKLISNKITESIIAFDPNCKNINNNLIWTNSVYVDGNGSRPAFFAELNKTFDYSDLSDYLELFEIEK